MGREICRLVVAMGHEPVSVSRGGRPAIEEPWVEGVEWVQSNILGADGELGDWGSALAGCDALIHAVGIGEEDPASGQSFARLHRESVALAARKAAEMGVGKFVFISADQLPPGLPQGYLQTKLDAESDLQGVAIPTAILRPSFIHDGTLGLFGALAAMPTQSTEDLLETGEVSALQNWLLQTPGVRLEKVAMAALRAALQPETLGVLDPAEIDYLGDAMFIQ
ncbi:putative NAD(P)-binding protein [Bradymonas sediminis]|nr:putative NAD(P)-binding protein [Bradymonas sediminis]